MRAPVPSARDLECLLNVRFCSESRVVPNLLLLKRKLNREEVAGDLRAQVAANEMGIRRLTALTERYGADVIAFYIDRLLEYTDFGPT